MKCHMWVVYVTSFDKIYFLGVSVKNMSSTTAHIPKAFLKSCLHRIRFEWHRLPRPSEDDRLSVTLPLGRNARMGSITSNLQKVNRRGILWKNMDVSKIFCNKINFSGKQEFSLAVEVLLKLYTSHIVVPGFKSSSSFHLELFAHAGVWRLGMQFK